MVELDKIRMQGRHFFKSAGNVVDLTVSMSIIFTVFLRLIYEAEKFAGHNKDAAASSNQ